MGNSTDLSSWFVEGSKTAQLIQLFEYLPRAYVYFKDVDGAFVYGNKSWMQLHGCLHQEDFIGKTDFDFHPPAMAAQYVDEDQRVMENGEVLPDQVWLVRGIDYMPRWYVSTKLPLVDENNVLVGVGGIMRPYEHAGSAPSDYHRLTPVMEHVLAHHRERLTVAELAGIANLSVSQLQREFRRLFNMSPGDYLIRVRLLVARRQLEETHLPVGEIALDCGFYDQSHFNRAFRQQVGLTPRAYRKRFMR